MNSTKKQHRARISGGADPRGCLNARSPGSFCQDFLADDYKSGLGGESPLPEWTSDRRLDFQHLTAEMLEYQNQVYKLRIHHRKGACGSRILARMVVSHSHCGFSEYAKCK